MSGSLSRLPTALTAALSALLLSTPALAGDPCPIEFTVYDLGAPSWLDRAALLDGLTSKDSWVGISFSTRDAGVRIDAVSDGSPAAKAGLKVGQHITAVDGDAVTEHAALGARFRATAPGATVALGLSDGSAVKLTLGRQDPVVGALIDQAARENGCNVVRRGDVDAKRVEAIRANAFHANRRFRCEDAHTALAKVLGPGDIVFVRGSKRVLLSHAGWGTVCMRAAALDGPELAKAVPGLFETLSKAYVAERHADP